METAVSVHFIVKLHVEVVNVLMCGAKGEVIVKGIIPLYVTIQSQGITFCRYFPSHHGFAYSAILKRL